MKKIFILLFLLTYSYALPLSKSEIILLKEHPLRCIATGEWAPFNLLENNQLKGIGLDYWHLIQTKLNIKSSCHVAKSWTEVLNAIRDHSSDVTIATQTTKERESYAVFSKPYVTYPLVIVTRDDIGFIDNINLLKGKKIVVGRSYTVANILERHYPNLKLSYVNSINDALSIVSKGEAFGTIEIFPVIAYKLNKNTFSNLKISGSTQERFSVSIMLRKDYAALLPLINKAINTITDKERSQINQKWISIHQKRRISRSYFYILLLGTILLILLFSLWLLYLKKVIQDKNNTTKQLERIATIDRLTNIGNRYMCDLTLQKEIALSKRHGTALSIIFFDIDKFKKINDQYGHDVGDKILQQVASLIGKYIRQSDTICRWGGDEFVMILPQTERDEAEKLAKQCEDRVSDKMFHNEIPISCTYGTAQYQEKDTPTSMISRADKVFYRKKNKRT